MTVNLLYALPKTALHERLLKENRVLRDAGNRDSNIVFLEPYENVLRNWQAVIGYVYSPEKLYARYNYNALHTFPNRVQPKNPLKQATLSNLKRAIKIFSRLIWHVGIGSDYRRLFWGMAWRQLKQGNVENVFAIAIVAHHLITYSRECTEGKMQSSNYSMRQIEANRANETLQTV